MTDAPVLFQVILVASAEGWGKDYFATTCLLRVLYELLCLKNPQQSLGLGAGEPIHIVPISHRKEAARRVVFGGVAKKMNLSPFFRGRFEETMDEIRFKDKNIYIIGGSSQDAGALGLNVFCSIMDELNFMGRGKVTTGSASGEQYDKAQMIYNALARRVKSRYQHAGVKGLVFLISSKRSTEDFTERKIREAQASNDASVFVRDYSSWGVRPQFYEKKKWYSIAVTPKEGRSRILEDKEVPPEGCQIFQFPEDFLEDFKRDPDGCITGDTKISLLDGRDVPVKELVGVEEFWTYSYTADGRLYPGRGHSARLTHKNAPIVEVELDNGEKIRCTPDHRLMLRDGTYQEASLLISGTSLMPLYRKVDKWGYEMVRSNVGGKWVHTHRIIVREHINREQVPVGYVVHHKNFDKRDNTLVNLEIMLKEDHDALHHKDLSKTLHSPEARAKVVEIQRFKAKYDPVYRATLRKQLEEWHETYDGSPKHLETASKIGKEFGWGSKNPSEAMQKARSECGTVNITKLNNSKNNPIYKEKNRQASAERGRKRFSSPDNPMFKEENKLKASVVAKQTFAKVKNWGNHKRWHTGDFDTCIKCHRSPNNHKVVSVRFCEFEDVYDISVDVYNNFGTTAGVVIHNSLRDIGGIATDAVNPFITEKLAVDAMMKENRKHIFNMLEWDTEKTLKTLWDESSFMTKNARGEPIPTCCPYSNRHVHMDLSKNGCATGFVIGHRANNTEVMRRLEDGTKSIEEAPIIHLDCVLRINAPTGGEIDHESIRELVYSLAEGGLPIRSVSMDQWCSVPNMQLFKQKGFKVTEQSVVKTLNPYLAARNAIYERRVESPVYENLRKELYELEMDKEGKRVTCPRHGCFTEDTKVKLLDGRDRSFKELVEEYGDGHIFYVYTIKDGKITVGQAHSPRVTKLNADIVCVTLDNGEKIRCTPDHRFMLRDGSYKEVKDLTVGESLMPLYTKISARPHNDMVGYELYKCPSDSGWHFTHRMVGKWKYPEVGYTGNQYGNGIIHHKNGKLNNTPAALEWMADNAEHARIHREDLLKRRADPIIEAKRIKNLAEYNNDPITKKVQGNRFRAVLARPDVFEMMQKVRSVTGKATGKKNITKYNKSEAHRKKASEIGKITIWKAIESFARKDITIEKIITMIQTGYSQRDIANFFGCHVTVIQNRIKTARENGITVPVRPLSVRKTRRKQSVTFEKVMELTEKDLTIKQIAETLGCSITTVVNRKRAGPNNHKVVSITPAGNENVYDLTVDETHNFALSSGVFVHNSKDICDAWAGVIFYLTEYGKIGRPVPPSKGIIEHNGNFSKGMSSGGPQYLGNGDWRWPDEQKAVDQNNLEEGGMSSWVVM